MMPLAQAQSLNEVFQECPGTIVGSTEPRQIHLQVTDDPTTMTVMWATEVVQLVKWNGMDRLLLVQITATITIWHSTWRR